MDPLRKEATSLGFSDSLKDIANNTEEDLSKRIPQLAHLILFDKDRLNSKEMIDSNILLLCKYFPDDKTRCIIAKAMATLNLKAACDSITTFSLIQDELLDFALSAMKTQKDAIKVVKNIHRWNITSASMHLKIAKAAAAVNALEFSTLKELEILNKDELIELCLKTIKTADDAKYFIDSFHYLNIKNKDESKRLEIAKVVAIIDSILLCEYIDAFNIVKDQEALVKLASYVASRSPSWFGRSISRWNIQDESKRLEIAKALATASPGALCYHIYDFNIVKDQETLAKLALYVASRSPDWIVRSIRRWNIQDESKRLDIAKAVATEDPIALCENINAFNIVKDQEALAKLALDIASRSPSWFGRSISRWNIQDESKRLEIAKAVATVNPTSLCENIDAFNIVKDQEALAKLALDVASRSPENAFMIAESISNWKIVDESKRLEIAKVVAIVDSISLCKYIDAFNIVKDQEALAKLALDMASRSPFCFVRSISRWNIQDESKRLEIAKAVATVDLIALCDYIDAFNIVKDQDALTKLALDMASRSQNASLIAKSISKWKIVDESKRLDIAKAVAAVAPNALCCHICAFNIGKDQEALAKLASYVASRSPDWVARSIRSWNIHDESKRLEIAKAVATVDSIALCDYIDAFNIVKDQEALAKLGLDIASSSSESAFLIAQSISKWKIVDESKRVAIARAILPINGLALYRYIDNFGIADKEGLIQQVLNEADIEIKSIEDFCCTLHFLHLIPRIKDERRHAALTNSLKAAIRSNVGIAQYFLTSLEGQQKLSLEAKEFLSLAFANHPELIKELPKTDALYKSLSIMDDPLDSFKPDQLIDGSPLKGISKTVLREEKADKKGNEKADKKGNEKTEKRAMTTFEQQILCSWLRYVMFNCRLYNIPDDMLDANKDRLLKIAEIHNPTLRMQLTQLLFSQIIYGNQGLMNALEKEKLSSALSLIPIITALLGNEAMEFPGLLEVLNGRRYRNSTSMRLAAIKHLQIILQDPILSPFDKRNLLKAIFPVTGLRQGDTRFAEASASQLKKLAAKKKAAIGKADKEAVEADERKIKAQRDLMQKQAENLPNLLNANLRLVANLIQFGKSQDLRDFIHDLRDIISHPPDEANYEIYEQVSEALKGTLSTALADRLGFQEHFQNLENFERLSPERHPDAFFTYASRLNTLEEPRKTQALRCLTKLAAVVMEESFAEHRYNQKDSAHLKKVFEGNDELRKAWQQGAKLSMEQLEVYQFLHKNIIGDRRLSPEEYTEIVAFLLAKSAADRKNIVEQLDRKLAKIKGGIERKKIEVQKILIGIISTTDSVARNALLSVQLPKSLQELKDKGPQSLLHEIVNLNERIAKRAKEESSRKWHVEDTDAFDDLLLIGTETQSCQSVTTNASTNIALLAYLLDGKIRAILVKNDKGNIVARRIVRLLIDEATNKPVLLLEPLYSAPGASEEAKRAVDAMCYKRAEELNLPLIGGIDLGADVKEYRMFPHRILSLGSPAPSEYVDTIRAFTNGTYAIPPDSAFILRDNKG